MKALSQALTAGLSTQGLVRSAVGSLPAFWSRATTGVVPYFAPSVVKRRDGYQIHGLVGVFVWSFEEWWASLLRRAPPGNNAQDTFLLGLYVTNLQRLMNPPTVSDGEISGLGDWLDRIMVELNALPSSFEQLESALSSGKMLSFPVHHFWGHPVKRLGFATWLDQSASNLRIDRPELIRTEPFTKAYEELMRT